jgi:hypothetical protein
MAYVRKKQVKGKEYYQLVQSRRVNGNPRQRVLLHLGRHPTVDAALKAWPREIKRLRRLRHNSQPTGFSGWREAIKAPTGA